MKHRTFNLLASVIVLALGPSCAVTRQVHYQSTMGYVVQDGRMLKAGDALNVVTMTELLAGSGQPELNPRDFQLDPDRVARIFAGTGSEVFSFVLMGDVQIDDRSLGFGPRTEHFFDKTMKIETTARGTYQDWADEFYLGFILRAIRMGLEMNTNLSGVMDVGDAIQIGVGSELAIFNAMMGAFLVADQSEGWPQEWGGTWLRTPIRLPGNRRVWLCRALGNHDIYLMGNFTHNFPVRIPEEGLRGLEGLVKMLKRTAPFCQRVADAQENPLGEGTESKGYYSFDQSLPDGSKARMIVLSCNEGTILDPVIPKMERGALYPSLSGTQFAWLEQTVREAQQDASVGLVLVFGHYPLQGIGVNRTGKRSDYNGTVGCVRELLGRYAKVKAYYCGHLHAGAPPMERRFGEHVIVEYVCPSIQEFPKAFGVAAIHKDPISGDYTTSVRYYNLEDLIDLPLLPPVFVKEDAPPFDQQRRFENWLIQLTQGAAAPAQRYQWLAKWCYESAACDVEHSVVPDIGLTFNPRFYKQLLAEYEPAQALWLRLKADPVWPDCRRLYEPSWSMVASTGTTTGAVSAWGDERRQGTLIEGLLIRRDREVFWGPEP
jgi:hypothetical protein